MTFGTGFLSGLVSGVLLIASAVLMAIVIEILLAKIREMFGDE